MSAAIEEVAAAKIVTPDHRRRRDAHIAHTPTTILFWLAQQGGMRPLCGLLSRHAPAR